MAFTLGSRSTSGRPTRRLSRSDTASLETSRLRESPVLLAAGCRQPRPKPLRDRRSLESSRGAASDTWLHVALILCSGDMTDFEGFIRMSASGPRACRLPEMPHVLRISISRATTLVVPCRTLEPPADAAGPVGSIDDDPWKRSCRVLAPPAR
jgi:hypothetical protein